MNKNPISATKIWFYKLLHTPEIDTPLEKWLNIFILILILLNVCAVVLATEPDLYPKYETVFWYFEVFSITFFTVEYLLRLWSADLDPRFSGPIRGRLKYLLTPFALIDLIAILPFYLPFLGLDLRFIRAIRLFRIFRVLKLGRYNRSMRVLGNVIRSKREDLGVTVFSVAILLIIASSIMYYLEHDTQPETFSSILNSMWWGVATLTTVGYGDIYPKTVLGKLVGSFIAILGIGLFALPTGIIASGFSEQLHHDEEPESIVCPNCGHKIAKQD